MFDLHSFSFIILEYIGKLTKNKHMHTFDGGVQNDNRLLASAESVALSFFVLQKKKSEILCLLKSRSATLQARLQKQMFSVIGLAPT